MAKKRKPRVRRVRKASKKPPANKVIDSEPSVLGSNVGGSTIASKPLSYVFKRKPGHWRNHSILATWLFITSEYSFPDACSRLGVTYTVMERLFLDPWRSMTLYQLEQVALMLDLPFLDVLNVVRGRHLQSRSPSRFRKWFDEQREPDV